AGASPLLWQRPPATRREKRNGARTRSRVEFATTSHTLSCSRGTTNCSRSPHRDRRLNFYADAGTAGGLLGRLHFHYFRHVMLEQILDAHLERGGRARAARARALHVQVDHAVTEILEDDVAAVLGHRRTHARLERFLD